MEPGEAPRELEAEVDADRRKFLASCGKFAAVTPPALTMLLSTSLSSDAIARSGGGGRDRPTAICRAGWRDYWIGCFERISTIISGYGSVAGPVPGSYPGALFL